MKAGTTRAAFRDLLSGPACVYPASVSDPVSARLAEDVGFELAMLAGSTAALSVLAAPDLIVLTMSELAAQARRICRASNMPLLVDADHGYGGVLNVRRTVEELENAGVAALTIEDTLLPAPYGSSGKADLVPLEEGVAKMRAALAARVDPRLAIVGRTSALQMAGLDEAMRRARAYEECGVDAVFLVGVRTWEQLADIRASLTLPLILGNAAEILMDRERLAGMGVRVCLQGHQPMAAAVQALHQTYRVLRAGGTPDPASLASPALMQQVSRSGLYQEWIGFRGDPGRVPQAPAKKSTVP
ncbi:MAG: oxaloacetate decarboxylase [Polaromonas sp.]|nr:oxaloacetate decarboxylase [Polaromonas sp.]